MAGASGSGPGRRAFRAAIAAGGAVATGAGVHSMLTGGRAIPGNDRALNAVVESELRFYSTFYAAYGLTMLAAAPRADREPKLVQALAGALFAAGLGRAAAWASAGQPSATQRALLALELTLPPALVGWQRSFS